MLDLRSAAALVGLGASIYQVNHAFAGVSIEAPWTITALSFFVGLVQILASFLYWKRPRFSIDLLFIAVFGLSAVVDLSRFWSLGGESFEIARRLLTSHWSLLLLSPLACGIATANRLRRQSGSAAGGI
jgi:hypothetical protein